MKKKMAEISTKYADVCRLLDKLDEQGAPFHDEQECMLIGVRNSLEWVMSARGPNIFSEDKMGTGKA